ncbi:MAG TPA: glycosyl hydrolase-related protein, partial [Anaerolineaceae bacterium]
ASLPERVPPEAFKPLGAAIISISPEELLPNPELLHWAAQMRQDYDVRFALEEDVLSLVKPWLDGLDHPAPEQLHPGVELNPNNSGCLVTRIRTKQEVRRQEYALFTAEALVVMAALKGAEYNHAALLRIRQDQYFTMFHDAITATHIDAAYQELLDFYDSIDQSTAAYRGTALASLVRPAATGMFSVVNASGQPVTALCTAHVDAPPSAFIDAAGNTLPILETRRMDGSGFEVDFLAKAVPPFSAAAIQFVTNVAEDAFQPLPQPVIENSRFRVQADDHGLTSVFDKALAREILVSGSYRPGELVLEHDEGSPWATLSDDQRRYNLNGYTQLVGSEKGEGLQRLVFNITAPREMGFAGGALSATLVVSLVEGLEQVIFKLHVSWHAFNHRLRVAMPVPASGTCQHRYEVPYGILTRQPYTPTFRWAGANGDWPAINWAGVEQPGMSVALFNKGIPSYRIEHSGATETILLSVLRAPCIPTYLHEPEYYSMTAYDGMRDEGEHDFEFAISAYAQPFAQSSVVLDGEAYNAGLLVVPGEAQLPPMPALDSACARIAALKWAEAGDGLVLRVVEFRGLGGDATLKLPFTPKSAEKVNLLERQAESLPVLNQGVRLSLRPWEIATLKLIL